MQTRMHHPRGFILLDAIIGMMITVAITAAVIAILAGQRRAAIQTADARAAVRAAESALIDLQSHHPAPADVLIEPDAGIPAPAGWKWVHATARAGSRTSVLSGLVPSDGGSR